MNDELEKRTERKATSSYIWPEHCDYNSVINNNKIKNSLGA